jgi:hypothetical protein
MTYRYTEEELADIEKRIAKNNLAEFERNSGRGLPPATVKAMEKSDGIRRDEHGAPVPKKVRAKSKAVRLPVPCEQEECENLIKWAQTLRWRGRPIAEVLIHIPNGAYLGSDPKTRAITMGKLIAIGVRPGVFDYLLAVPTAEHPGLWLEMKRTRGGEVSADQKSFRRLMTALGWRCEIAKGWTAASRIIEEHLAAARK